MQHKGAHPYNAETTIDFRTKEVKFNYPQEITRKNTWKAYAGDITFILIPCGILAVLMLKFILPFVITGMLILHYAGVAPIIYTTLTMLVGCLLIIVIIFIVNKALGGISIIAHEHSSWLRKTYPKRNAKIHRAWCYVKKKLRVKREVDFSNIPSEDVFLRKRYMIFKNILIMDYNIVYSEYDLSGDCAKKIKRIYTKCVEENEKKRNKPSVSKFKIVFEFDERPKRGKVVVW